MRKPADPTVSTDSAADESFYGRWSRRKRLERAGRPPGDPAPSDGTPPAHPGAGDAPSAPAPAPAPVLTDADMPDVDTLGEDDDYSAFLSPGVSDALRNRALRKLFMSSKFNVVDGLNDYDGDFTAFEPLGDIVTSDMRHQMERIARELEEQAAAESAAPDGDTPPPPAPVEAQQPPPARIAQPGTPGEPVAGGPDAPAHRGDHDAARDGDAGGGEPHAAARRPHGTDDDA